MYGPVRTVLWEDGPLRGASYPTLRPGATTEGFAAASGMRRNDESDEGAVTAGAADGRLQHHEGSGRGERLGVRGTSRQRRASRPSDRPANNQRPSGGATRAKRELATEVSPAWDKTRGGGTRHYRERKENEAETKGA